MPEPQTLPPRYRMWLWIWGTILCTAPLMGIFLTLARVAEWPLIAVFAPAVVLGPYMPADSALRGIYYLMPVQCLIYGLLLARSELSGKRQQTLVGLTLAHIIIAARAISVTAGHLPM